ncbi:MAG TPA: hypothetical protein VF720_15465, partial [Candidatus Eisenbacteria bacterium]
PDHWRRVERNGITLAMRTGADLVVVKLFALFHDAQRRNDGDDPEHGARGAAYAAQLRNRWLDIDDWRFALLEQACTWHTAGRHHDDPTIGSCWDADRLDLTRLGILPDPAYMSTPYGRELAAAGGSGRRRGGRGA